MDYFDLFEFAKTVGHGLETTQVWLYGEDCDCGCKYMVLRCGEIVGHYKTLKQVERALKQIEAELKPYIERHEAALVKSWEYAQLRLF